MMLYNSAAERSLRAGADSGGERAGNLYSLIGIAKLCGLDPQAYLQHVLTHIAQHSVTHIEELLPWNVSAPLVSVEIAA
jgi:transposase